MRLPYPNISEIEYLLDRAKQLCNDKASYNEALERAKEKYPNIERWDDYTFEEQFKSFIDAGLPVDRRTGKVTFPNITIQYASLQAIKPFIIYEIILRKIGREFMEEKAKRLTERSLIKKISDFFFGEKIEYSKNY